jgi:hypothetical protein
MVIAFIQHDTAALTMTSLELVKSWFRCVVPALPVPAGSRALLDIKENIIPLVSGIEPQSSTL